MENHDPKLKEAMKEIEAVCEKYQIGAFVSLVSKTHGEFRYHLPNWIGLHWEYDSIGTPIGMRLRLKGPATDQATQERADLTGHFIYSTRDLAALAFQHMDRLCKELEKKGKVTHSPLAGYVPHREPKQ